MHNFKKININAAVFGTIFVILLICSLIGCSIYKDDYKYKWNFNSFTKVYSEEFNTYFYMFISSMTLGVIFLIFEIPIVCFLFLYRKKIQDEKLKKTMLIYGILIFFFTFLINYCCIKLFINLIKNKKTTTYKKIINNDNNYYPINQSTYINNPNNPYDYYNKYTNNMNNFSSNPDILNNNSIADQIKILSELRNQNIISEEEFNKLKDDLMSIDLH